MKTKVLITDGNQRSALAATRALGRAGAFVTVAASQHPCLAGVSRYCSERITAPSVEQQPEAYGQFLRVELEKQRYGMMLPMTDNSALIAADLMKDFSTVIPMPSREQILLSMDKEKVMLLAKSIGIACPVSTEVCSSEECEELGKNISYPVVIKPRSSRYLKNGVWHIGGVQYAWNARELLERFETVHAAIPRPLIQEYISGEGRGVFIIMWDGEIKAVFCHRRIREKPPSGGVSVLCESIAPDDELIDKSAALLRSLNWRGVAMVEYKMAKRDSQPKLMEVNGRFWGSLQLAIDAGVDFPVLLHKLVSGHDVPLQKNYAAGVRCRWLLGDLDNLLIQIRAKQPNPDGSRTRSRAISDFLTSFKPSMYYDVLRSDDLGPGWLECKQYVRQLFERNSPRAH